MALSATQRNTVLAAVNADPTMLALKQAGNASGLKDYLNEVPSSGAISVWRTETPVVDIVNAINWAQYTPSGAVDDTTLADALTANRRATQLLAIQTKQMNLQTIIQGRDRLNCVPVNVRAGLRDAVVAVPAGLAGANVNPGGANGGTVLAACTRGARRAEAILVGADSTTGATTAKLLVFEGQVDEGDVNWIVNN